MAFTTLSLSFRNVFNTVWKIGLTVAISCSMRSKKWSEFLGERQEFFLDFLVSQMHSKHRSIKSFIAEFTAIFLYQFPVTFQGSVFVRFSVELIHNLNTDTVHSTTKVLHDMKAIEYNFCIGE